MSIGSESDPPALENLSALTDGELDSTAVARACAAWREEPAARSAWHAYQLIGDVLRSEDLACNPGHDAAFLARLREQLATQPTVLAPEPLADEPAPTRQPALLTANGARSSRWSWMAPSAVAAGFVLVAGALMVTRSPFTIGAPSDASVATRSSLGIGSPITAPALADAGPELRTQRVTSKVIRDSRLDRYLAAHQQFAGTTALGVPSGFLRNAAADVPNH